jgi:site-specific DNA-methyltransferase (adenine-specific)
MTAEELPVGQVLLGDCREILAGLPEASVDLVFADPPYNLQLRNELRRPNDTLVDAVDDEWDRFASFQEYDEFTRGWLTACRRVLKDTGTLWVIGAYHNIYRVGAILQDLDFWILNDVVWIKSNPMPNFRGVRFTNAHETLLWAQKKRGARYTFNHYNMKALNDDLQMRSDWYLPLCTGRERLKVNGARAHSTQKPEALLYRILLASTHPGDVVLDPFFGSGTTGAAAHRLGRRWIGIERSESYALLARERIASLPPPGEEAGLEPEPPRRGQPRVAFGRLVETGLLRAGQTLYFGEQGEITATVLANGHLSCGGSVGSIHMLGKSLLKAPCNGWDHWYYLDETSGERVVIDRLRQKMRADMTGLEKES